MSPKASASAPDGIVCVVRRIAPDGGESDGAGVSRRIAKAAFGGALPDEVLDLRDALSRKSPDLADQRV